MYRAASFGRSPKWVALLSPLFRKRLCRGSSKGKTSHKNFRHQPNPRPKSPWRSRLPMSVSTVMFANLPAQTRRFRWARKSIKSILTVVPNVLAISMSLNARYFARSVAYRKIRTDPRPSSCYGRNSQAFSRLSLRKALCSPGIFRWDSIRSIQKFGRCARSRLRCEG